MSFIRDESSALEADERAAEAACRAVAAGGFLPLIVIGERHGQHYEPYVLQIGKMTSERANRAMTLANAAVSGMGYHAGLHEDWRHTSWSDDVYDENEPVHWVVPIVQDE